MNDPTRLHSGNSAERPQLPHEVYGMFHDKYGVTRSDIDGYHALICGRVIHFNNPEDRSTHISIFEAVDSIGRPSPNIEDAAGHKHRKLYYLPRDFLVVATSGNDIERLKVARVHGTHGEIDTVRHRYSEAGETLHFELNESRGVRPELHIGRTGKHGSVLLANGRFGWILGPEVSLVVQRQAILPPESTLVDYHRSA